MKRRNFLGGLTAASFGALLENSFTQPVQPPNSNKTGRSMAGLDSFESSKVEVSGNTIFVRRYGSGPAILMVHGFPRTSLMWRFLCTEARRGSHRYLRRSARLRSKWDTCIYGRSLSLFQARNGGGTG
jgi:hypothetical protein